MKRTFAIAFLLVLFAIPSFAANKPQVVTLTGTVQVGSTQLPAGEYKVTWTGTGNDVQITIAAKGKPTVTAKAQLVNEKHDYTGVSTTKVNGTEVLDAILFPNVTLAIHNGSSITGN
jgi:hypothetical protein